MALGLHQAETGARDERPGGDERMKEVRKVLWNEWNALVKQLCCGIGPPCHMRGYLELGELSVRTTNWVWRMSATRVRPRDIERDFQRPFLSHKNAFDRLKRKRKGSK